MQGLLFYAAEDIPRNRWFIEELCSAAESEGMPLRLCAVEELSQETVRALHPDFAVNRSRDKKIAEFCEDSLGIRVYNNAEVTAVTNDKWQTHSFLRAHGLPTADTVRIADRSAVRDTLPQPPLVAKPIGGHGGAGVEWLADADEVARALREKPLPFLLQAPMVTGWDLRVYVMGGAVYAAMLRTSETLCSNFSLGGKAAAFEPDAEVLRLVDAVQRVLPLDFAGIDLLRHPSGHYVIGEIEDAVGCRMLYQRGGCDPARDYMRMIARAESSLMRE